MSEEQAAEHPADEGHSPIALTAAMALVTRHHMRLTHPSDGRLGELGDAYGLGVAAWTGKRSAFVGFYAPPAADPAGDLQKRVAAAVAWGRERLTAQTAETCDILLVALGSLAGSPPAQTGAEAVRVGVMSVDPATGEVTEVIGGAKGLASAREMRGYAKTALNGGAPTLAAVDLAERETVRGGYVAPARTALIRTPYVTYGLIACFVAIWGIEHIVVGTNGHVSPDDFGSLILGNGIPAPEWWRFVASGFLHIFDTPIHLAINSWAMYWMGRNVEQLYGRVAVLASFIFCVIGASLFSWGLFAAGLVQENVHGIPVAVSVVGASGGLMGLLGMMLVIGQTQGKQLPRGLAVALRNNAIGNAAFVMIYSVVISGIAWYGHLGGLIAGALWGLVLPPLHAIGGRDQRPWEKAILYLLIAFGAAALLAAAINVAGVASGSTPSIG